MRRREKKKSVLWGMGARSPLSLDISGHDTNEKFLSLKHALQSEGSAISLQQAALAKINLIYLFSHTPYSSVLASFCKMFVNGAFKIVAKFVSWQNKKFSSEAEIRNKKKHFRFR